jgi:hypothetical protein
VRNTAEFIPFNSISPIFPCNDAGDADAAKMEELVLLVPRCLQHLIAQVDTGLPIVRSCIQPVRSFQAFKVTVVRLRVGLNETAEAARAR